MAPDFEFAFVLTQFKDSVALTCASCDCDDPFYYCPKSASVNTSTKHHLSQLESVSQFASVSVSMTEP